MRRRNPLLARHRSGVSGPGPGSERGLALVAIIMVLALIGGIIVVGFGMATSALRSASADYQEMRAFYAAEAGAEAALGQLKKAVEDGVITEDELEDITPPELEGFDYSGFRVERKGSVGIETITDGPFANLYAYTHNFVVHSKATDASGAHAGVQLAGKAQAIPIFQFGWFSEGAGNFGAGKRWDAYGRVHSNRSLHLHGCDSRFHDVLTTPGTVHRDAYSWHHPLNGGATTCPVAVYIEDGGGNNVRLTFDSEDTPDPAQFKAKSNALFDGRLKSGAFGVEALRLPLPDGVPPRELIRPIELSDGDAERAVKFAWQADMYVKVDLADLEPRAIACAGNAPPGAPAQLPKVTVTRTNGYSVVPDAADECAIFRFRWESFYNNHEERWIDILDVDIGELRTWTNGPGDGTSVLYVEFENAGVTPTAAGITDPNEDGTPKAGYFPMMRIVNGAQLPGPLTLGAERMVWVQGDYNTVAWQPSAVFGDQIGMLSNAWDDSKAQVDYSNPTENYGPGIRCEMTTDCPRASHTSQYFAYITSAANSLIPTCYHEEPGCTQPDHIPAGANSLLENWYLKNHTLVGSFITLWKPETVSLWFDSPGANYYYPPNRDQRFETRFEDPANLPPATPMVGSVLRAAFRSSY